MKAFCIFDDYPEECIKQIKDAGIELDLVEKGHPRPSDDEMKKIFENYNIVIIGTSQKIYESMWENVDSPRVVATASVGIDHIHVPENKQDLLTLLNAPNANTQSVAEFTVGALLMMRKRIMEGNYLYYHGLDNKKLIRKPEDIAGTTVGLVGAGRISTRIIQLLYPFGVNFLCFTKNANRHHELTKDYNVEFVDLMRLARESDVISVNVPNDDSTYKLINKNIIDSMKKSCIYISVSRESVSDIPALICKAEHDQDFYVFLDQDINSDYVGKNNFRNIIITPHIAGGTIESRKRMFKEITNQICYMVHN